MTRVPRQTLALELLAKNLGISAVLKESGLQPVLMGVEDLGALLVGVVRGLTSYFLPPASEASMYLLMVLVLLFRPRGLFGERIEKFE